MPAFFINLSSSEFTHYLPCFVTDEEKEALKAELLDFVSRFLSLVELELKFDLNRHGRIQDQIEGNAYKCIQRSGRGEGEGHGRANCYTHTAAITQLPSTTHPQSWAEPHIHVHMGKSLPSVPPSPEEHNLPSVCPSTPASS